MLTNIFKRGMSKFGAENAAENLFYYFGWVLVLLHGASYLYSDDLRNYVCGLLITLMAYATISRQPYTVKQPILWLFYLAWATQLMTWGVSNLFYPEMAESSPKLDRLSAWFLLLPVAVFTRRHPAHVYALWIVSIIALLASPWLSGDGIKEILRGFHGIRIDFNLHNAEHMGMLFGVANIALAVFSYRFFLYTKAHSNYWLLPLYIMTWLASLLAVLASQTRAVWLSLSIAMAVGFIWLTIKTLRMTREGDTRPRRQATCALLIIVVISAISVISFSGAIQHRVKLMEPAKLLSATQNPKTAKDESVRVRLSTWKEAFTWIAERPIEGWGGKGRREVVRATPELRPNEKKHIGHLHNSYLDITVTFGLCGMLLCLALFYVITSHASKQVFQTRMSYDVLYFWILFLTYWAIVNIFESYMFFSTGTYIISIVGGGVFSLSMQKPSLADRSDTSSSDPGTC